MKFLIGFMIGLVVSVIYIIIDLNSICSMCDLYYISSYILVTAFFSVLFYLVGYLVGQINKKDEKTL
jgi:hypothetical protein